MDNPTQDQTATSDEPVIKIPERPVYTTDPNKILEWMDTKHLSHDDAVKAYLDTRDNFKRMLTHLHRGGARGYWWTLPGQASTWWPVGHATPLPKGQNIYFGVHPATKGSAKGERSKTETIAAINCLFAEFDEDKGSTIDGINSLPCKPSILIRSGGGWHGYWLLRDPFILATDADRKRAMELQANWVDFTSGDPGAKDLPRILRVPGTLNHKYDPPRIVEFIECNFGLLYDLADLEALCVASKQPKPATKAHAAPTIIYFDDAGEHWLADALLDAPIGHRNERGKWLALQLRDALLSQSEAEPFMIRYAQSVPQVPTDMYTEAAAIATLKSIYVRPPREPAKAQVEQLPQDELTPPENLAASQAPKTAPVDRLWSVSDLLDTQFPDPEWVIPNKIATGFSILGGRPKKGKTWMALQIAHAKATGGTCLGEKVEKGKVLFLALEDSPRRLKKRCQNQGIPKGTDIDFGVTWRKFDKGGLNDLLVEIISGKYSLIIVDCLSRAMGKYDQLDLSEMAYICGELQNMAIKNNANILAIDHHGKMEYGNPVDDIIGSTGKSLAADTLLGLYRDTGKHEATLKIIGRDLEDELEIALEWEALSCTWKSLGDAGAVRANTMKADVLRVMKELIKLGELATTQRIASYLQTNKANVSRALGDLLVAGQVRREAKVGKEVPYVPF